MMVEVPEEFLRRFVTDWASWMYENMGVKDVKTTTTQWCDEHGVTGELKEKIVGWARDGMPEFWQGRWEEL